MATSTSLPAGKARPRRRWWRPQFRLRSLLALMLAACGAMGWWRWNLSSYPGQQRALEEISSKAVKIGTKPGRPAWLRPLFDAQWYRDVTQLSFHGRQGVTDADLAHVARFPRLEHLSLESTSISDEGLAHLSGLVKLETLSLKKTKITSAGLAKLRGLKNLKTLQISDTQVDGSGVAHLAGMKKLEVLELDNLAATGDQLEKVHIAGFPRLKEVTLSGPPTARYSLRDCPALASLQMEGAATLVELRNLPNLRQVELVGGSRAAGTNMSVDVDNLAMLNSLKIQLPVELSLHLRELPALRNLYLSARIREVHFDDLPRLDELTIPGAGLDRSTLAQWREFPATRHLGLTTRQDDIGFYLSRVGGMDSLERLSLWVYDPEYLPRPASAQPAGKQEGRPRALTDSAFSSLSNCQNLREINLHDFSLKGEELADLAKVRSLRSLSLSHCSMRKGGLRELGLLPGLKALTIRAISVSDANCAAIASLPNLESLTVSAPKLRDDQLVHFHSSASLRQVEFSDTIFLSRETVGRLSAALSADCRVTFTQVEKDKVSFRPVGARITFVNGRRTEDDIANWVEE